MCRIAVQRFVWRDIPSGTLVQLYEDMTSELCSMYKYTKIKLEELLLDN